MTTKKASKKSTKKAPSVVMYQGVGIVTKNNLVLTAYEDIDYALLKFKAEQRFYRESRLVLVTARLENVSARQLEKSRRVALGPTKGKLS